MNKIKNVDNRLFAEYVELSEIKQKINQRNTKYINKEYETIKKFIKDMPIEFYLNKK